MEKILTNTQKLYNDIPTRLELLQELNARKALSVDENLQKELIRLERGAEGEEILYDYLKKYGEDHWIILRNVWIDYEGLFECDLLVITYYNLYIFEVKNYRGTFELKNNIGWINEYKYSRHPITQAQNVVINLEKILKESSNEMKVNGVVAFVGADNIVNIQDTIDIVKVKRRNELRDFIWGIANNERYSSGYPIDREKILNAIGKYEVQCPYPPEEDIPEEVFENVHEGIYCCHCGNYDVDIAKKYIICPCGMHEPRDEAIVRTICEYGVIHYKENFTSQKLVNFFNDDISRSNIINILNKYFKKLGDYKNTEYLNQSTIFIQIYDQFGFTDPKKLLFY